MRVTQKELTLSLDGKETLFRVHLMDAFTGAWLLKLLAQKLFPYLADLEPENERIVNDALVTALPDLLEELTARDLKEIMVRCLNHAEMELPAGWQPVMSRSSFGIPELEHDTLTCLKLCAHVILFNLSGFFPEGVSLSPAAD